jgi:hypothetical protein
VEPAADNTRSSPCSPPTGSTRWRSPPRPAAYKTPRSWWTSIAFRAVRVPLLVRRRARPHAGSINDCGVLGVGPRLRSRRSGASRVRRSSPAGGGNSTGSVRGGCFGGSSVMARGPVHRRRGAGRRQADRHWSAIRQYGVVPTS